MDENEEKKAPEASESGEREENRQEESLHETDIHGSAVTERESELPKTTAEPIRGLDVDPPLSMRMRTPRLHYRMIGSAIAIFLLIVAVLLVVMTVGRGSEGGTPETTQSPAAESDSTAQSPESTSPEMNLYAFDPTKIPEGHIGFYPMDLSGASGEWENRTDRTFDVGALMSDFANAHPIPQEAGAFPTDQPLVLILHTHTTEGYSEEGALSWDGTGDFARSQDGNLSVAAVGKVLADRLTANGIPTVHCTLFHDIDAQGQVSNAGSYARAEETVAHYRALYPSIRYVIDLHREVLFDQNGYAIRPVTAVEGKKIAQIMGVVGNGESAEQTASDLALALLLSETMNRDGGSVARPVLLKDSALHSESAEFSLTFEIGSAANSLAEANSAAEVLADALATWIVRIESAIRE